jgi:hypothetical protein
VALCQARISTKPLWGFSSSNPYHSQSRAEQCASISNVLFSFRLTESWRMNAGAVTWWNLFYVHDISHNAGSVTTHSRGFKYVMV